MTHSTGDDFPKASVSVDVVPYDASRGVSTWWDDGGYVRAEVRTSPERLVVISGNSAGLRSLARHLLTLAEDSVPAGSHLDFDKYCGALTDDSVELRLKIDQG